MAALGRSAIGANSTRVPAASVVPSLVGRAPGARRQSAVVCQSTGPQQPGPLPPAAAGQRRQVAARAKPGETPEQALERRIRESAEVEERVIHITSQAEWDREVEKVGAGMGAGVLGPLIPGQPCRSAAAGTVGSPARSTALHPALPLRPRCACAGGQQACGARGAERCAVPDWLRGGG